MNKEGFVSHETDFVGKLRFLKNEDIPHILPLLTHWIRDRISREPVMQEINGVLNAMAESVTDTGERFYLVAEKDGKIVGVMGLRPPEDKISPYAKTQKPIELINAFVDSSLQGKRAHVGSALVSGLTKVARSLGCTEIILSSGPRYENTGWEAWRKLFGPEIKKVPNFFAKGVEARIWRKEI